MKYSLFFLLAFFCGQAQEVKYSQAQPQSVVVYRNAAEISNNFTVNLPKGVSDLVVTNVAPNVDENSVRLSTGKNITILSVQKSVGNSSNSEIDEANPQVKKVRDSIKIVSDQLTLKNVEIGNLSKAKEMLDKNQNALVGSNNASVTEISKFLTYYQNKRNEIDRSLIKENDAKEKLQKTLQRLNDKLNFNTDERDKIASGKLIFRVMNASSGSEKMKFTYLTSGVYWKPMYEIISKGFSDDIQLNYNAVINQKTGLDWKGVKLTLVSTNAGQSNQIPELNPWFLYAFTPKPYQGDPGAVVAMKSRNVSADYEMAESVSAVGYDATQNTLSTRFDTSIPYDILSNGKNHSVRLKDYQIPAEYKYYSVPKLETCAYLMAEISDYSQYNLLPGEASIIFEDVYVGKTMINPLQTGDNMKITLGKDERIAIKREKIENKSSKKTLSSSIEQRYAYQIKIRNNKSKSIEIEVRDQYPISQNKDIEIELKNSDGAKVNETTHLLEWNLKIPSNTEKELKVEYQVKYPKDLEIQPLQ